MYSAKFQGTFKELARKYGAGIVASKCPLCNHVNGYDMWQPKIGDKLECGKCKATYYHKKYGSK